MKWFLKTILLDNLNCTAERVFQIHVAFMLRAMDVLTARHHPLQPDDVGMVELSHDWGLSQEVPPLLVCVTSFQGLDGHTDLLLAGKLQATAAHLTELTWRQNHLRN